MRLAWLIAAGVLRLAEIVTTVATCVMTIASFIGVPLGALYVWVETIVAFADTNIWMQTFVSCNAALLTYAVLGWTATKVDVPLSLAWRLGDLSESAYRRATR